MSPLFLLEVIMEDKELLQTPSGNSKSDKISYTKEAFEWLEVIVGALLAVVLVFTFAFRIATIEGESMENTLFEGEKIIITDWYYTPKAGDIVVVSRNINNDVNKGQEPIIKRVIATEGQTVDIDFKAGIVYVDGVALQEDYIKEPTHAYYDVKFPVRVPEGHIFCLGDNRNESLDSRSSSIGNNGMIDVRYVLGHASFRILPFSKMGGLD